ncbi:hypothetical protein [Streptomyces sp. NRRL S-448]|uniref:hypothetical protein n=1 Tax=Streptomyces sp. NRRL S-448 TaxID=1463907 RepID=UPI003569C616
MRTRLCGFIAAMIMAALGAVVPVAQAAVPTIDGQMCLDGKGSVEYESAQDSWICVGGSYNGASID